MVVFNIYIIYDILLLLILMVIFNIYIIYDILLLLILMVVFNIYIIYDILLLLILLILIIELYLQHKNMCFLMVLVQQEADSKGKPMESIVIKLYLKMLQYSSTSSYSLDYKIFI